MLKITVDTNILVSAALVKGNEFKILKFVKEDKLKLILSLEILKEFKEVILRPKFNYPVEFVNDELKRLLEITEIVFPIVKLNVINCDPSDNKILGCAVSGNGDYIISGDSHLLDIENYKNIKIVNAGTFLKENVL